jgi:hypothetical protein
VSVRERAEHLITLAEQVEAIEASVKGLGDFSLEDVRTWEAFKRTAPAEAPWVARQLLEALNRIDQLEAENEDLKRSGPTFGGDAKISGYHSTSEPLNPKEADE